MHLIEFTFVCPCNGGKSICGSASGWPLAARFCQFFYVCVSCKHTVCFSRLSSSSSYVMTRFGSRSSVVACPSSLLPCRWSLWGTCGWCLLLAMGRVYLQTFNVTPPGILDYLVIESAHPRSRFSSGTCVLPSGQNPISVTATSPEPGGQESDAGGDAWGIRPDLRPIVRSHPKSTRDTFTSVTRTPRRW